MRLWNLYKENLSEDVLYKAKLINIDANYNEYIFNLSLIELKNKLISIGGKILTNYGLPQQIEIF